MQTVARLAKASQRPVAAAASAGAAAVAIAPVALADAPARVEVEDVLVFKPDEIDEAFDAILCSLPATSSAFVEELDNSSSSSSTGPHAAVDAVLDCSSQLMYSEQAPLDLSELCIVAKRLLSTPGVQREVCRAALSDPEVFGILASKADLGCYLEQAGFASRGLLLAGNGAADSPASAGSVSSDASSGAAAASSSNLVLLASRKVADSVEAAGLAVARLGHWMRTKLGSSSQDCDGDSAADESSAPQPGRVDSVLGAVMVICVAVVAVLLMRRPSILLRRARA